MALKNIKNLKSNSGFTIVELLIVIVVIAILATISIVAYNGIQDRAKTTAGQELASQVVKKFEALNAIKGSYYSNTTPAGVTGADMNDFANAAPAAPEGRVDNPSSVVGAGDASGDGTSSSDNGTVVRAWACANGTGVKVFYYDFTGSGSIQSMTAGTAC